MRLSHYLNKLYLWFLPYTCLLCHQRSTLSLDLCRPCLEELPSLTHSCSRCANELPASANHASLCGECLQQPPPFHATYSLFIYRDAIKKLILNLKFRHTLNSAKVLGELLTEKVLSTWYKISPLPDVIIPVPLHRKRLRERGFNQALEIARPIAKQLGIKIDKTSCTRIKHTAAQATLHADKRKENIQGAFLIKKDFSNRHIVILDDVITTGLTVTELAKALKKAGASRIDVWSCARTTASHSKSSRNR